MKRTLALVALILAALLFAVGCNNTPSAPPADTTAPESDPVPTDLELIKNGATAYTIVRPENADQATIEAASLLRKNFGTFTGVSPLITTDWIKPGDSYDPNTYEILVGRTAYPESSQALEGVLYGDYVITVIGNKLVINAWCSDALDRAITDITKQMLLTAAEGSFTLSRDNLHTATVVEQINALPIYADSAPSIVYDAGDENLLLLFERVTPDSYTAYCRALEEAGYTLYTQNDIADNHFATYITDDYVVNAGYYGCNKESRIIIEPRTVLPGLPEENQYTGTVDPSFAMLGLGTGAEYQNGQSFIWQLADGSYIIVDGGFNRDLDGKNLYQYMYDHAPDPQNITVAAWIITHAHGDHHGAYFNFADNHSREVTVERVIGNFPSDQTRRDGGLIDDGALGASVMETAKVNFQTDFIKTHVGYKFYLRNAEIEFLYTLESYMPRKLDYFNTTSLVFTVTIGGQRFLITGDASEHACTIISKMYGSYLKSDYVQIAHHGYTAGANVTTGLQKLYTLSEAPVVIWPVGDQDYGDLSLRNYNKHLTDRETTKEILVAGNRIFRITLPYTPGTSGQPTILK